MSAERVEVISAEGAEIVVAQIPPALKRRSETVPVPSTAVIQVIEKGKKFKELFEFKGTKPNFRRVVQRTTNLQVTDRDSWDEFAGAIDYFLEDFPAISKKLDRAVLGELYIASRRAFIRSRYDFQRNYFQEDIEGELKKNKLKAIETIKNEYDRELFIAFSVGIFDRVVFQGSVPEVKL